MKRYMTIDFEKKDELSDRHQVVLGHIRFRSGYAEGTGWCMDSKGKIADWYGIGRTTVFGIIKELIECGYIEKNERGDLRHTKKADEFYTVLTVQKLNGGSSKIERSEGKDSSKIERHVTKRNTKRDFNGEEGALFPSIEDEIIKYLNIATEREGERKFRSNKNLRARIKEGQDIQMMKNVIDLKVMEWTDTKMEDNLNPGTLFRPENFEKYKIQVADAKAGKRKGIKKDLFSRQDAEEIAAKYK